MTGFSSARSRGTPYNIATDKNYTSNARKRRNFGMAVTTADSAPPEPITYTRATQYEKRGFSMVGSKPQVIASYEPITVKVGERGPTSAPLSIEAQAKAKAADTGSTQMASAPSGGNGADPKTSAKRGRSRTIYSARNKVQSDQILKTLTGV